MTGTDTPDRYYGEGFYGEAPFDLGPLELPHWHEFMHYLYLPVRIPGRDTGDHLAQLAVPWRLEFLRNALAAVRFDAMNKGGFLDPYMYVSAVRGYATPGNPLNRPGWHCDDFGGHDLNYIWSDAYPTRLLRSDFPLAMPQDDTESMTAMQAFADRARQHATPPERGSRVSPWTEEAAAGHLLRLTPYVIHATPNIPEPGGMRSFFKVSVSDHRYNLLGNSHNYALNYDWPMHDRAVVRNQPTGGNTDHIDDDKVQR